MKEEIARLVELAIDNRVKAPGETIKYGKQALALLERSPDPKERSTVLCYMSAASSSLEKHLQAEEYAREALADAQKSKDKETIARALNAMGKASALTEKFDGARDYYSRALKLYKELENTVEQAKIHNFIGGVCLRLSDFPGALENFLESLKLYDELGDQKGIDSATNNIGVLYFEWGVYEKSLEYYNKSLLMSRKLGDQKGIAISLSNIGNIYRVTQRYERALEESELALKLSNEVADTPLASDVLINIGEIYKEIKEYKKALEYFNDSLKMKINKGFKVQKTIARVKINIAFVSRRMGRYENASLQAKEALAIAQTLEVKAEISDACRELSEVLAAMNQHQEALKYYKQYKEAYDSIFNDATAQQITRLQVKFAVEKEKRQIAELEKEQETQKRVSFSLIVFACFILAVSFLLYTRYRLKSRVTRALQKEIEERKQTEEKLRESEEKFRVLAEKSVVGIWIIKDNAIKYANPRHSKIFGYTLEEMIDKSPLELVVEEDRALVNQNLSKRMNETDDPLSYEFKGYTKAGEVIHLESYGSLTQYQGQMAVLETIIDITDRKKVEMELLKSRKLESVGILAGGIAHDFNNLLTIIIGNITMTKMNLEREAVEPRNYELLENAEKASYQATDLAQKFITFSEGGWIAPRKVTLASLLKNTIHLYPDLEELQCHINIPDDLKPLYGDERQLREVMINLLLNASEAIPGQDKEVVIQAENKVLIPGNEFLLKEGEYVKISVIDNGRGIPSNQMEKIFDPYFSTKNQVSRKGLGLGLAICYSIIKKHEGHIAVKSEVGSGTTVDLYLPAYLGKEKQVLV